MHRGWIDIYKIMVSLLVGLIISLPVLQVQAQEPVCGLPFESVSTPLDELGSREYIRMDGQATGFAGGLYPQGSNSRPTAHEEAGLDLASQIVPLGFNGNPDPTNGKIVLMSIGMSNTNAEFGAFMDLANSDKEINPQLFLLNGALGGQTSERWLDPNAIAWQELERLLERNKISTQQVQVAWVKLSQTRGGDFPEKALALQDDLEIIVQHLQDKFSNLKMVYLSSRTRSYTYWRGLSPEPVAFETGFAVKWLIEKQIQGDPALNYNPAGGEVRAPYLSWGPYLWIDGLNPRADGLVWSAEDMTEDCTHPSKSGQVKVGQMLLEFFKTDSLARSWFLAGQEVELSLTRPVMTPSSPAVLTSSPQPTPSGTPGLSAEVHWTAPVPLVTNTETATAPSESQSGMNLPIAVLFLVGVVALLAVTFGGYHALRKKDQTIGQS